MPRETGKKALIVTFFLTQCLVFFTLFFSFSFADIIDDIFNPSISRDSVINLGESKDMVGGSVFGGGIEIVIKKDENGNITTKTQPKEGLIVRITKILLKLTLILGVSITVWLGIKFTLAAGDSSKRGTATKEIGQVALGIIIALGSVAIIYLLISFSNSLF